MTKQEEKHYRAICLMCEFREVVEACCEFLPSAGRLLKLIDRHVVSPWEALRADFHSASSTINVALVGKFSSGKSTFINSIMGAKIAPSSLEPTTRSITTFCYGESLKFYDKATGRSLSETDYFSAAQTEHKEYIVELPCERLKSFSIIDTPGFNPPEIESADGLSDKEMSKRAVEGADVLFYLVNITKGSLGEDGLAYLKGILEKYTPDIYIILNQADSRAKKVDRDAVKASIKEECKQHKIPVVDILEYSSLWDGNRPGWRELRMEGTTIEALREDICNFLNKLSLRKDEIMNTRFKSRFNDIVDSIIRWIFNKRAYRQFEDELKEYLAYHKASVEEAVDCSNVDVEAFVDEINRIYIDECLPSWIKNHAQAILIPIWFGFFEKCETYLPEISIGWKKKDWSASEALQAHFEDYGVCTKTNQEKVMRLYNKFAYKGLSLATTSEYSFVGDSDKKMILFDRFCACSYSFFTNEDGYYKTLREILRKQMLDSELEKILTGCDEDVMEAREQEAEWCSIISQVDSLKNEILGLLR